MTAAYAPEAYVFGSPENHDLLEAESNELLHFGHRFPAPNGGSTWLDDRGNPDPSHGIQTLDHPAAWRTSTRSAPSTANQTPRSSLTRRSTACAGRCMMM